MTRKTNVNSTIEELEGDYWGAPDFPSHLLGECHRLRKLQLGLFTVENLRVMLGQDIGSRYLVPIALEHLEADPFVSGDFYPGDLLCNVLSLPSRFWAANPDLRSRVAALVARAVSDLIGEHDRGAVVEKAIREAYDLFLSNGKTAV